MFDDDLPCLSETVTPPVIRGAAPFVADLAANVPVETLLAGLVGPFADDAAMLAAAFDTAVLAFLSGRRDLGLALQQDVLDSCRLFRIAGRQDSGHQRRLRVLAFAAQGDLQMNTPIEFITENLDVQLDLLFIRPGERLPAEIPDHDVAICIVSDSHPMILTRLAKLLARWPRPVVNDPARLASGRLDDLTRDGIARLFADSALILAPPTVCRTRAEIMAFVERDGDITDLLPGGGWPLLIRPVGSHAGQQLERLRDVDELGVYVASVSAERFYLSRFIDYRSRDGFYRKHRVALIEGRPFLCHMAVSDHWMIHYLNAGMAECAAKRRDEAAAMADFDAGFGHRHRDAFALLHRRLGLDYVVLDCAEAPGGELLLFEVEMAAIVHALDPASLFAYKPPQMRRVFDAFDAMLRQAAFQPAL